MALVVSPVQAAAITLPILIVQDVVSVWAYRHTWDRRNVVDSGPGRLSGIVTGYLLAAQVSDAAVKLAVGVISVAFAIRRMVVERRGTRAEAGPGRCAARAVLGLGDGLYQHGRPCGRTALPDLCDAPAAAAGYLRRARVRCSSRSSTGSRCRPIWRSASSRPRTWRRPAALFPVAIASTWAGVLLVRRVSGQSFYTAVYVLLVLVGAKLVYDGAAALF